ncbi:MAG TPA: hypothetical protein VK550_04110 [Polyangiaceae bacterium]|nr:hypothetical protein [Polyangiaceae bacterium]
MAAVADPRPVQLRHRTALTSEEYVTQQGWQTASLEHCPLHPQGGCGFARHTPYWRVEPPGMQVARYYCPEGHTTFSLLPDCLASRLSSTLAEVEQVVVVAEMAPTVEQAARQLRPDIEMQGAVRWLGRRVRPVRVALLAIVTLVGPTLGNVAPTLTALRTAIGTEAGLVHLREVAGNQLRSLPPPLGFGPRPQPRRSRQYAFQHEAGADPPGERR